MPKNLIAYLKTKPNKSAFIAEAVLEKLIAEERRRKEMALAKSYRDAAGENMELLEDWDMLSGEGL